MPLDGFITGIITLGTLADSIGKMKNLIPTPAKTLQDKHRWLTITVFNQTQYVLQFGDSYFDSGKFWAAPTNVEPFGEMTFSGCDKDMSYETGVSGGASFTLQISETEGENVDLNMAFGFTNPQAGSTKISGLFNVNAVSAYKAVGDSTTSFTSDDYTGQDTNLEETVINFKLVASPGQEATITLTEQIVSGGG